MLAFEYSYTIKETQDKHNPNKEAKNVTSKHGLLEKDIPFNNLRLKSHNIGKFLYFRQWFLLV